MQIPPVRTKKVPLRETCLLAGITNKILPSKNSRRRHEEKEAAAELGGTVMDQQQNIGTGHAFIWQRQGSCEGCVNGGELCLWNYRWRRLSFLFL